MSRKGTTSPIPDLNAPDKTRLLIQSQLSSFLCSSILITSSGLPHQKHNNLRFTLRITVSFSFSHLVDARSFDYSLRVHTAYRTLITFSLTRQSLRLVSLVAKCPRLDRIEERVVLTQAQYRDSWKYPTAHALHLPRRRHEDRHPSVVPSTW